MEEKKETLRQWKTAENHLKIETKELLADDAMAKFNIVRVENHSKCTASASAIEYWTNEQKKKKTQNRRIKYKLIALKMDWMRLRRAQYSSVHQLSNFASCIR